MVAYTVIHVVISLIAIASGFVVLYGFFAGKDSKAWTSLFLSTTVLTSVTGFGFPAQHLTPGHVVGVISLVVLGFAVFARNVRHEQGGWQRAFVINSTVALYLNVFVLVAQLFQKAPALKLLAPTQSEAPFAIAQAIVLAAFLVLGTLATYRSRTQAIQQLAA